MTDDSTVRAIMWRMVTLKVDNVPDDLHQAIRIRVAQNREHIRDLVLRALQREIDDPSPAHTES